MEWYSKAQCIGLPTDWFFDTTQGINICRDCTVRKACLSYAKDNQLSGVWGGRRLESGKHTRFANQFKRKAYDAEHMFEHYGVIIRIN